MVEGSYNFQEFVQRLPDEAIEALLHQVAREELSRHQATRAARHGVQEPSPAKA